MATPWRRAGARARARFRWRVLSASVVAASVVAGGSGSVAAADRDPEFPDLGVVRYRDPAVARAVWLGLDVGGTYVPESLGLFDRSIWLARTTPSFALALTEWLAIGGRHGLTWYDASTDTRIRLRVHEHQLELSGRPLASNPSVSLRDRLAIGITSHRVASLYVGDTDFRPGGLQDFIVHAGYGIEHALGPRWALGWQVQFRYAWVFVDTQRQLRASLRGVFRPRPPHELQLQAVLYAVHRDEDQAGNPLDRGGAYGQFDFSYAWMSRHGVGPFAQVRFATSFLSGEAPVFEIREEALNEVFADLTVGMRAVWGVPVRPRPRGAVRPGSDDADPSPPRPPSLAPTAPR